MNNSNLMLCWSATAPKMFKVMTGMCLTKLFSVFQASNIDSSPFKRQTSTAVLVWSSALNKLGAVRLPFCIILFHLINCNNT